MEESLPSLFVSVKVLPGNRCTLKLDNRGEVHIGNTYKVNRVWVNPKRWWCGP